MLHCGITSGGGRLSVRTTLSMFAAMLFMLHTAAWSQVSGTEGSTEDQVKAALVFNFVRYTGWPTAVLGDGDVWICSLSATPLSSNLAALDGQRLEGRTIRVRVSVALDDLRSCHVLYIAAQEVGISTVLRYIDQIAILTVSDQRGFVQAGGVIGLRVSDNRIRFDINQQAAGLAGLSLSSQLLRLAEEVIQ